MKLKSEARECFINFKQEAKVHHNKDIKWVHPDNGGECGGSELNAYVESGEIILQPSTPYSPGSNGVADSVNHTLMAKNTGGFS